MGIQTPERATEPAAGDVRIDVIARAIFDNFNLRRVDESAQWVADDCVWEDVPTGTVFRGPDGYVEFDNAWIRAFPDARIEVTSMVTEGDMVVTEFDAFGTQQGPLTSSTGETIAPTGKAVQMRCIEVHQYGGGQVVRARFYYDALTLLRQLDAIPWGGAEGQIHEEIES